MTTAWCKKLFYDCVDCVCVRLGTIFLVFALFMAIGFLKGVMTTSFALPIDLFKSVLNSESGLFTKILFKKTLN